MQDRHRVRRTNHSIPNKMCAFTWLNMSATPPHRIDTAQKAVPPSRGSVRLRGRKEATVGVGTGNNDFVGANEARTRSTSPQSSLHSEDDPEAWLRAHATDLIRHLQTLSIDLDQREASLNARIALHERRERQFRIQRSELSQQLATGQTRVDQLRQQLEARTRRLAFENHS